MLCVTSFTMFAQEAEQIELGPYGTLLVRTNKKPIEYYETQMKLWEKKVHQNKKDANAWLNYFSATKCAYQMEVTKLMENSKPGTGIDMSGSKFQYAKIADQAYKNIPTTFEGNYIMHNKDNYHLKLDYTYLLKAQEIKPFDKRILWSLLVYYEGIQDTIKSKSIIDEIAKSNFITTIDLINAKNMLSELEDNAVLVSVGYEEYIALLILQKVKSVNPRVIVTPNFIIHPTFKNTYKYTEKTLERLQLNGINNVAFDSVTNKDKIDLISNEDQLNPLRLIIKKQVPLYFSNSIVAFYNNVFGNKLFLHGLTYRYSEKPISYIHLIKSNYGEKYVLDFLKHDFIIGDTIDQTTKLSIYLPSLLSLAKYYKEIGNIALYTESTKLVSIIFQRQSPKVKFESFDVLIDGEKDYPFITENLDLKKIDKEFPMFNKYPNTGINRGPYEDNLRMGKYEVTNKDYRLFLNNLKKLKNYDLYAKCMVDSTKWNELMKTFNDPMVNMYGWHPAFNNYPVVNISYEGAVEYCKWLTEQYNDQLEKNNSSHPYVIFRLPTEEEWRYAAGSKNEKAITPFPNDNIVTKDLDQKGLMKSEFEGKTTIIPYLANIKPEKGYQEDGGFQMLPVHAYPTNDLGLHNTFGNVAELTSTKGIIKGGSWADVFENCTFDKKATYSAPDPRVGFRIMMEIRPDIADLPTLKLSPNLGVDKSEITHFYWEEFLNYQKQYYGENSPEYRDNLPDTTLVKKGECEHYNSESYKHPAYRNMPMIGVTQQQALNYTTWRTNRIFEWYLESNEYITRIVNAPKSDFTVEKYYQNSLTDYKINTFEKYPYVPVFSLPSSEDYQRIKQLAIANNKLNTKSKSVKMTFEIDSIALCNLNEINSFIDPKYKNVVYYLESGIAEWTSDSNKVINGSIEVNENHKKGVVTDANQLKYIGFRNMVKWKRWEGIIVQGTNKTPEVAPCNTLKISQNLYCDQYDLIVKDYKKFVDWNKNIFGENSNEYKNSLPDTSLWNEIKKSILFDDESKVDCKFKEFETLNNLTNIQLEKFNEWRSNQAFKDFLISKKAIQNISRKNETKENYFTKEKYFNNTYPYIISSETINYYPNYRLASENEKRLIQKYSDSIVTNKLYDFKKGLTIHSTPFLLQNFNLILDTHSSNADCLYYFEPKSKKSIPPFNIWENYRMIVEWKPWNPNQTK